LASEISTPSGHLWFLWASASRFINAPTLKYRNKTTAIAPTTIRIDIQATGSQFITLPNTFMAFPPFSRLVTAGGDGAARLAHR
jgi:hypothetical protein